MRNRKIRVAVVGAGEIGKKVHIPAYLANTYSDLVAIVDVDEKKALRVAKKFHVKKVFPSVEELFKKEEVDAISICTPPDSHADIALTAFKNGAHVLCEKPLAVKIEDGIKMIKASRDEKRILMVGFHRRFITNYQRAKMYISRGDLGHVYCVEDHFIQPNPLFEWGKSQWFFKREVGGVLFDIAPHVFDMLNFIFDDFPIAISAYGSMFFDSQVEESCVFIMEYPKKRIGIGVVSWLSPVVMENLSVYGTGQNMFASPNFLLKVNATEISEVSLWRAATKSLVGLKFPNLFIKSTNSANPYQREIDYFVEQVRKNNRSEMNALNALSVLFTCAMAKKSIEKHCRVEIALPYQA